MAENHIEVDSQGSGEDDSYSDYSSGLESDRTSLISIVKNHTFENGRRFHALKQGAYYMPNDEKEQDRMDLAHHYHLLALGGELYMAPIKDRNPQRILDLGTGTGIWAIDVGDQLPGAEVIGVDLSPIQPRWVPPNVVFEVDDFDEEWTWPDNYFDYIHLRSLAGWLDAPQWPRLVKQAYRVLKPGGYIELQDLTDFFKSDDGSVSKDSFLNQWIHYTVEGATELGKPWLEVPQLFTDLLEKQGFTDIAEHSVKCPIGQWPKDQRLKDIGTFGFSMKFEGVESFTLALFTRTLGWDLKRLDKFVEDVKKDLRNPRIHSTERFYCIFGRKPGGDTS